MNENSILFNTNFDKAIKADFINWILLKEKTVLITGATGLIGTCLINLLDYANQQLNLNINILAFVRNETKATERFKEVLSHGKLKLIIGSVESLPEFDMPIDYIVHGASQTASKEFIQHAVETIETSVLGTINLLNLAKEKAVKGFVYLSSMEVYGSPERGCKVSENEIGKMSPLNIRNSYPIAKVMSEAICCAYAEEYGVPARICRLTQTFGPEIGDNDNRLFAYFVRCIRDGNNIVLKTKGESERCYLHTTDAATSIITILLKGQSGRAYNAADKSTYCSIAEIAEKLAAENGIKVEYNIQDEKTNGFPKTMYINLDTSLLEELGWRPEVKFTL